MLVDFTYQQASGGNPRVDASGESNNMEHIRPLFDSSRLVVYDVSPGVSPRIFFCIPIPLFCRYEIMMELFKTLLCSNKLLREIC